MFQDAGAEEGYFSCGLLPCSIDRSILHVKSIHLAKLTQYKRVSSVGKGTHPPGTQHYVHDSTDDSEVCPNNYARVNDKANSEYLRVLVSHSLPDFSQRSHLEV